MHKELADLFAEVEAPAIVSKRAAHDQLAPILRVVAGIQQQVARHRELMLAAELAPHEEDVDGGLERLQQTLGALDTDLKDMVRIGRRVALSMTQFERYGSELKEIVVKKEKDKAPK